MAARRRRPSPPATAAAVAAAAAAAAATSARGASTLKPPIPPSPPPLSEAASPASASHWPAAYQAVVGRRARAGKVRRCAPVFWRDSQAVHCCSHSARNVNKLCDEESDWLTNPNPTLLPIL